jgi:hypothetical protein
MVAIGVGTFLLSAQELPTGTIGLSDRAFIERPGLAGSVYPAAATHELEEEVADAEWRCALISTSGERQYPGDRRSDSGNLPSN